MKLLSIVGARPQFVKAAIVEKALAEKGLRSAIIHTGQHFDDQMSAVFFRELDIPEPKFNLGLPGGNHGAATGAMLKSLEDVFLAENPDAITVYGDTNTTLAAALAAAKLHIPVFHVEAGLRSFNRRMPEEINRVLTDHISALLLCPTKESVRHLFEEGIRVGVHHVGDVMYDAACVFGEIAREKSTILSRFQLEEGTYSLATLHRAENTDTAQRLKGIVLALERISEDLPVILPLHPRTKKMLDEFELTIVLKQGRLIEPVGFLDMVRLEQGAKLILTDSGGVQKEAYFHRVPCVTFRDETEWNETVSAGWNQLAGTDTYSILQCAQRAKMGSEIDEYGIGKAGEAIASRIIEWYGKRS